ncbi:hypothetical protein ADIMK_1563 [Marinobacterium lacunae]|uniref:Flagellin protein FlaG n=1 Tax=Marinobacterium lacunae TaxID=1232683 RepID=A0A081G0L2_9GAMM|nr:flagellar protein FlaG [Marinobacterium lacunae]KEA64317.1 hypothetical protein ADIMK_1563 [Marinobacterium lacunae]
MNTTISSSTSTTLHNTSSSVDNSGNVKPTTSQQGTQGVKTEIKASGLTVEEVNSAVQTLNEVMTKMNRALSFEVDSSSEELVIRVTDTETDELIRQIPSENALKLVQHITEMRNILFDASA